LQITRVGFRRLHNGWTSSSRWRRSRRRQRVAMADVMDVSEPVREVLLEIQHDVADAYRESFIRMVEAINVQTSMLQRIQETLNILIRNMDIRPGIDAPTAFRIADKDEQPDVASAVIVADPIAAGYTLSQKDIAEAVGISSPDTSILVRAFDLNNDDRFAVVVRSGPRREIVNYNRYAIDRFLELVKTEDEDRFDETQTSALRRARRQIRGDTD
jgi:hypothetical protein